MATSEVQSKQQHLGKQQDCKMCRSSLWTEIIYKTPKVISEVVLVFRNAPVRVEVEHLLLVLPDIACEKCEMQIALPHQRHLIPGSGCHRCGSTFQGPHLMWDCNGIATIKYVWGRGRGILHDTVYETLAIKLHEQTTLRCGCWTPNLRRHGSITALIRAPCHKSSC